MRTTRETGQLGEDIACKWLENHGYFIVERNYHRKWGELDIIATKDKIVHFIEVKSAFKAQNHNNGHRPEENVHELKVRRLKRVIQTYLLDHKYGLDCEFKFHVVGVVLNTQTRHARVNLIENVIL